jgi:hypothetical protein
MARSQAADLKSIRIEVAGTKHENRPELIKTLRAGSQVSLVRKEKNKFDENAIAVMYRHRQLGWIPRQANLAILGLKTQLASIVEVGTDSSGSWTHLVIEIKYEPSSPVGKMIKEHGAVVASILKRMVVPDLKVARSIAELPPKEQHDAVDQWNEMQMVVDEPKESRK